DAAGRGASRPGAAGGCGGPVSAPSGTSRTRTPRRCRRWWTCVLVALALAGCSGPSADEVRRQHRAEAEQATQHLMDQMEPLVGVGTPVGSAVRDSCETGQHNWKVDDAFDVRCTVQVTRA